jgi:hypothetical protein
MPADMLPVPALCSSVTALLTERQAKQLVFFPAFVADGKVLLDGFQSFGDRFADEMKFGELPDLHQADIAVDFDGLRGTHHIKHFLKFRSR